MTTQRTERIHAIDWLRGLVMVLMVLDHCRDFFGDIRVNPTDISVTTPALFFTRWITHFCAPVFVFLSGTSAWLYGRKHESTSRLSRFLWTRGLWLVFLEMTVVQFGWTTSFLMPVRFFQVIGAIGVSMVVLSAFVYLPVWLTGLVGALLVLTHNVTDGIAAADMQYGWIWTLLREGSMYGRLVPQLGGYYYLIIYPILPWLGVMMLGYAFGSLVQWERPRRRKACAIVGCSAIVAFAVLRWFNIYGDPSTFQAQATWPMTVVSFFNCEKYPPSLLFVLMTLGPALLLLAALDGDRPPRGKWLITFGQVPLFFYVVHLIVVSLSSAAFYKIRNGEAYFTLNAVFQGQPFPESYGNPLWAVYLSWFLIVLALYPVCSWYAGVKRRSQSTLLSYL